MLPRACGLVFAGLLLLAGCVEGLSVGLNQLFANPHGSIDASYMLRSENPPKIAVSSKSNPSMIEAITKNISSQQIALLAKRKSRHQVSQLSLLRSSAEGQRFLASEGDRAMAIGEPSNRCPALKAAAGASPQQAVSGALDGCLAQLRTEHKKCGCRLIAFNNYLTAPLEYFTYAKGMGATFYLQGRDKPLLMVAEESSSPQSEFRHILFRDAAGKRGKAEISPEGDVTLHLSAANGQKKTYRGRWRATGIVRGRFVGNIQLSSDEGHSMKIHLGDPKPASKS